MTGVNTVTQLHLFSSEVNIWKMANSATGHSDYQVCVNVVKPFRLLMNMLKLYTQATLSGRPDNGTQKIMVSLFRSALQSGRSSYITKLLVYLSGFFSAV